jgi:opacity protein-like surface antigen
MMQKSLLLAAAAVVGLIGVSPVRAAAQAPVPDTGMTAGGLTLGMSVPHDDALDSGVDLGVQLERYVTPRVSVRAKVSGAWFDIEGRPFPGTMHPIAIEGNIVHNWERGAWHPYATAGVGWYRYGFDEGEEIEDDDDSEFESDDDKFGVNFGGGLEYFLSLEDTLLGEFQLRVVPGRTESLLSDYEPGYWSLVFGYKRYF